IFLGVPCQLGEGGLQRIIEVELTKSETEALASSAEAVRETIGVL
ncbi:MAG TPA: malate dehydrogenase, partial [Gemmatimonadetes bacterium]|nr:malate dehydrogenase [Gemmatimonadota bacterium]